MRKDTIDLIAMLAALAALIAMVVVMVGFAMHRTCGARWHDRETQWGVFSGCLVEWEGSLVPEDRVWFKEQ